MAPPRSSWRCYPICSVKLKLAQLPTLQKLNFGNEISLPIPSQAREQQYFSPVPEFSKAWKRKSQNRENLKSGRSRTYIFLKTEPGRAPREQQNYEEALLWQNRNESYRIHCWGNVVMTIRSWDQRGQVDPHGDGSCASSMWQRSWP